MTKTVLTTADLDELGMASVRGAEALTIAAQLEEAADEDRLADPADVEYAYLLASDIHEREGQLDQAMALAERAIAWCERTHDDATWPRASRAKLLFMAGRDDEAMTELAGLRPRLTSDKLAASTIADVLEQVGRAETAMHWLTAALEDLRRRYPDQLPEELSDVVYQLAVVRHRIRGDLELPHDDYDEMAHAFMEATDDEDDWDEDEPVLLWWPADEYTTVASRWPDVLAGEGSTWREYRRLRQVAITAWNEQGFPALHQVTGTADGFAEFLAARGLEGDAEAGELYSEYLADRGEAVSLPPGRNERCWCGSGVKYKKCCLPRARGIRLEAEPAQA